MDTEEILENKKVTLKDYVKDFFDVNYRDVLKKRLPILSWLPTYTISILLQDLLAGFTVGLTEIPQGIAYAGVAGLPPQYGLYSGFMGGFVYAIFGSCKDVNIGPTSIMALMIQTHVQKLGYGAAVIITFLSGIIVFIIGLLHLGFVVEFFSYPIIAGFTCAGALQIASSQIKSLFGITGKADAFLDAWKAVFSNLDQIRKWDTTLGLLSIVFLVALREIRRFGTLKHRSDWSRNRNIFGTFIFMLSLARNALIVIIGTGIAYSFRHSKDPPFLLTGNVDGSFPPFEAPPFEFENCKDYKNGTKICTDYNFGDIANEFGASIAFTPLVAILEAIAIAKAFSKGKSLDATQEMIALGLSNIMGSFVRSMPVTGSFTRTAVNNASGVVTPLAGIFTSFMVLLAIGFLTSTFQYVPKATLASIIICAMFYLFDFAAFAVLWKNKKLDLIPFLVTILCCLFISLEYGILIGIGVNLLTVLYASARPKFHVVKAKVDTFVITPKDTLLFPAAEHLRDAVLKFQGQGVTIIINGKYIRNIDITVAKTIVVLAEEVRMKDQNLFLSEFKQSVMDVCTGIDKALIDNFERNEASATTDAVAFEVQTAP